MSSSNSNIEEKSNNETNTRIATALFSIMFCIVLFNGYYHLFVADLGKVAIAIALLVSFLAWFVARIIGTSEGGMWANKLLLFFLLTLSAVGVFNSMMINLEGKRIFQEVLTDSRTKYSNLINLTTKKLYDEQYEIKQKKIDAIAQKLYGEIRNPRNCGEGPVAESIIAELQKELPGFQPLSKGSSNEICNKKVIEDVIESYNNNIALEMLKTDECIKINCTDVRKLAIEVKSVSETNLAEIDSVSESLNSSRSTLRELRPKVQKIASNYESIVNKINSVTSDRNTNVKIPSEIDVSTVEYLGQWSKFPQLFWARIWDFSTWLYLLLAITFDVLMIHFFTRTQIAKNELRKAKESR